MPYLEVLKGLDVNAVELKKRKTVVGRSEKNDVVLGDITISRKHARFLKRGEACSVEDLKSRHGTYVNGVQVTEPTELKENDLISICGNIFRFRGGDPADLEKNSERARILGGEDEGRTIIMSTCDLKGASEDRGVDPAVKLRAVMEIMHALHSTLEEKELLPRILESLFRVFPQADRGLVLGVITEGSDLELRASLDRDGQQGGDMRVSQTIVKQALEDRKAILSADAQSDSVFSASNSVSDFGIRSIMCAPLLRQNGLPLGALQVHAESMRAPFSQEDLEVLVSVASTTAMALENLKLHEELVVQERIQRELQLARDVQRRFLPPTVPSLADYSFYASYRSASSVGGDYYGFIALPDGRWVLAVGDVSGKGMPAAMLMARLSSDVRYGVTSKSDPGDALDLANQSLVESGIDDKFVTLVLMVLDPTAHTLTVANAGHPPPLLRRANGTVEELDLGIAGFPLLVSPDPKYHYRSATVEIEPGAVVLAYTDGVTEAMDASRQLYGVDRLGEVFEKAPGDSDELGKAILDDVEQFAPGNLQHDDITLLCVSRKAP